MGVQSGQDATNIKVEGLDFVSLVRKESTARCLLQRQRGLILCLDIQMIRKQFLVNSSFTIKGCSKLWVSCSKWRADTKGPGFLPRGGEQQFGLGILERVISNEHYLLDVSLFCLLSQGLAYCII